MINRKTLTFQALLILLVLLLSVSAWAVAPYINYQGQLTNSLGEPINNPTLDMSFSIWLDPVSEDITDNIFQESQFVNVANGIYNVQLGLHSGGIGDPSNMSNYELWLEVTVEGETLSPRAPITSVPAALWADKAGDADTVGGLLSTDLITGVTAGRGLSGGGTSGEVSLNVDVPLELKGSVNSLDSGVIKAINDKETATSNIGILGTQFYGAIGKDLDTGNLGGLGHGEFGVYGKAFKGSAGYFDGNTIITGDLRVDGAIKAGETDPIFSASTASGINGNQVNNWDNAYSWGNHSAAEYDATNDSWTGTGNVFTLSGNVGIGTSAPEQRLDVNGNSRVRGNLVVDGSITGTIDVSQITGLLGQEYTLQFPSILDNYVTIEIEGIHTNDPVVVLSGPGYDIERIPGFHPDGKPDDTYGFSMEHPFIIETSGVQATDIQYYFDSYTANPTGTGLKDGALIIKKLDGTEAFRCNFLEFKPDSYEPGLDGRTRFTFVNRFIPNTTDHWQILPNDPFGANGSFNPATDQAIEIEGVAGTFYAAVTDDPVARTLTFTYDIVEGFGIFDFWVKPIASGQLYMRKNVGVASLDPNRVETGRINYYELFPIQYQLNGFGLDTKIKATIVLAYNFSAPVL